MIKLLNLIYFQFEYLILKFLSFFIPKSKKGIALIRVDAIGDYILFRNYIQEIKNSPFYSQQKITLIGNIAWKELSEHFDKNVVDEFIWIDRQKIWRNKLYRFLSLFRLASCQYETIINSTYSREFHYSDSLVRIMNSPLKIAQLGDFTNSQPYLKKWADHFYDHLLESSIEFQFEFDRNKFFFSNLLNRTLVTQLQFPYNLDAQAKEEKKEDYIVLFIGSAAIFRRWSNQNYLRLGQELIATYHKKVVFCGTINDLEHPQNIKLFDIENAQNLVGKTPKLLDLISILQGAAWVVSNETSIPHICVAINRPVFVISNIYGRFNPYPIEVSNKHFPIFHPVINSSSQSPSELSLKYGFQSDLKINDISVTLVLETISDKTKHF